MTREPEQIFLLNHSDSQLNVDLRRSCATNAQDNLENVKDFSNVCRTCAAVTEFIVPIFEGEGVQNKLADKIHQHLPIKVSEQDSLPRVVCYQCASTLLAWHELVKCCLQADEALKTKQAVWAAEASVQEIGAERERTTSVRCNDRRTSSRRTFKDDVTVTTEKTDYEAVQDDGTSINSTKLNPIENVIKVVKFVTETITKNTRKGFKSKINYLNKLKNTLMNNIVTKIEALWPDDDDARSHRKTRQARGHVEFPSSEGALMSISFLTFAVFLIKLVMQLIQTFRNNNPQFVAPAGAVLVGRAASAISKRAGRLTGN